MADLFYGDGIIKRTRKRRTKGDGMIRRRKDGRWEGRIPVDIN